MNEGATGNEQVDLNDLVEIQLAATVSLADVAHLEREVPGIGAAVSLWLRELRD